MAQRAILLVEPFVEKNQFRQHRTVRPVMPEFEQIRPELPSPILPGRPALESLYWAAWKALWAAHANSVSSLSKAGGNSESAATGWVSMAAAPYIAPLAGYLQSVYPLMTLLDGFYAFQHDDGYIAGELDPQSGAEGVQPYSPDCAVPNLLAWAEWRYFRLTGDSKRIESVFWPLLAYHRWRRANTSWPSGLYWTTETASGLKNQPRVPDGRHHHQHWSWVDASSLASMNCRLLESMAILLGEAKYGEQLRAEHDALISVINAELWNDELKFYQDAGPTNGYSKTKSIAAYWALHDSMLVPADRLTPFVQHLRDNWSFGTKVVLPSLSADSDAFNAQTGNGWRGGVWPSLTYMVLCGLMNVKQYRLAHTLARLHIDSVAQVYGDTETLWRSYSPFEARPGTPVEEDRSALTASALIAMTIEYVVGVSYDQPLRQLTWHRYFDSQQPFGIRNYPLGNEGSVDLESADGVIRIHSELPFTLTVHTLDETVAIAVSPGASEISLN